MVRVVIDGRAIFGGEKLSSRHTTWDIFPTTQQSNARAHGHGGHGIFRDREQAHVGRV